MQNGGCPAFFIVLLGSIPYLYAYSSAKDDEIFMGFIGRGTPGATGYLMFAQQAQERYWLFENRMAPEPVPRTYFNSQWLLFGKVAAWSGLSLMAMFHVWRVLSVTFFFVSAYFLISLCVQNVFQRRASLLLMTLGADFGWILLQLTGSQLPMPVDIKGMTLFRYLVNNPHFIRAAALTILTYAFLILGERRGQRRYFVFSALAATAHVLYDPTTFPKLI